MHRPFRGEMPIVLTLPLGPLGLERKRLARRRARRRTTALVVAVVVAFAALVWSI